MEETPEADGYSQKWVIQQDEDSTSLKVNRPTKRSSCLRLLCKPPRKQNSLAETSCRNLFQVRRINRCQDTVTCTSRTFATKVIKILLAIPARTSVGRFHRLPHNYSKHSEKMVKNIGICANCFSELLIRQPAISVRLVWTNMSSSFCFCTRVAPKIIYFYLY